jgi:glycerol kinase
MQFQADILGAPVVRPKVTETTALGAAYLAGLAVDYWKSTDDVKANWEIERKFDPHMSDKDRDHRRSRWSEALRRAQDWEERSSVDVTPTL